MKRLPIQAAKDTANKYDQAQVVLITFDKNTGLTHIVSYGKSLEDCVSAAELANTLKKYFGFPDALCHDTPARAKGTRLACIRAST